MAPTPQELEASLALLQSSLEDLKRERVRDRAEFERRLRVLELEHGQCAKEPELILPSSVVDERENVVLDVPKNTKAAHVTSKDEQEPAAPQDSPEQLEHELGGTVWEAAALVGLPQLGCGASVLLAFNMFLNALVQIFLCVCFLNSPSFVGTTKFKDLYTSSLRWRFTVAHQLGQVDASGTSLAARVCGGDQSLAVASSQAALLGEIEAYLDGSAGLLICMVCLLLFVVLVMRELRCTMTSLLAVAAIPLGPTCIEDGGWVAMSVARKLVFLLMGVLRVGVAVALLCTGILWLSSTSSTTDLILNAAALGFVMDLDELLLETTVPAAVHAFVGTLHPVVYRKPRWHMEAVLPLLLSAVLVVVSITSFVVPNMLDMEDVQQALCGGNKNFIATRTAVSYVVSTPTADFDKGSFDVSKDLELLAVQELRNADPSGKDKLNYSMVKVNKDDFVRTAQTSFVAFGKDVECGDMDAYADGVAIKEIPAWFTAVRLNTGVDSGKSLADEPWTCSAHLDHCDTSGLLRHLCPITCGCSDPLSGLFYLQPDWGCPTRCKVQYLESVSNSTCEDQNVVALPGWARYWQQYGIYAAGIVPQHAKTYQNFSAAQASRACSDILTDPLIEINYCDESDSFLASYALGSILPFCPGTCCSGPNPPSGCPVTC